MEEKGIVNYLFELGMLKKLFHNGPQVVGVNHPDTISEHCHRAAVIGFILGEMEGVNSEKVATMLIFHDGPEARIGDHNKIAQRYIDNVEIEKKVIEEQVVDLPKEIGEKIKNYWFSQENKDTPEGRVAYDADILETALQAKEYLDLGYGTEGWIENVKQNAKTESAKKLIAEIEKTKFTDWWKGLKKL
ncbi:HD domain-containing protein [Patescibacteria group bacterium]|nr:HD domain-containing protein [Patescibacteria group bacterium]